jgi:hypothetical protein
VESQRRQQKVLSLRYFFFLHAQFVAYGIRLSA